jgi:pimeloyl-ACP methyl ester carboxylesterase
VRSAWRGLRRWQRRTIVAALVLLALAVAAWAAAGYYFSQQLLSNDRPTPQLELEVVAVEPRSSAAPREVTLEAEEETLRDGTFGLDTDTGYAILGEIVSEESGYVTRRVRRVQGELDRGTTANVATIPWNGDPKQSIDQPFEVVESETDLGPMPSWYTPGRGDTWAVMVHGYKSNRRGLMRDYGVLRDARLPILNVTYRNDPGNPEAPDGLIQLGQEEWRDVQSAMEWATGEGAERFVVFGDSMGGAIVSQLYHESDLADRIDALVLDAPVLDWNAVLELQTDDRGLPGAITTSAEWWIERRIGIDFAAFDQIARADEFEIPILLFHGTEDDVVPFETSEEFAAALSDLVTFYPADGAGHVQAWNIDPELYERRLARFLAAEAAPAP